MMEDVDVRFEEEREQEATRRYSLSEGVKMLDG